MTHPISQELANTIAAELDQQWEQEILPLIATYIEIPNKSPHFDKDWEANGYMAEAMDLLFNWVKQQPIKDLKAEVITEPGRTPLMFIEIPGQSDDTIFLYGHMDKQPEMTGWDEGLGPWKAVRRDDKLYGRGGADDGYSVFSSLSAIAALQRHGIPHARCVVVIEACEESGSYDLMPYLANLSDRIGTPSLIIGLDSGAGNYEQIWSTTSLRGVCNFTLEIDVLREGMHSGMGSGIVPSAMMIFRTLLARVEDQNNSQVILKELAADIPQQRIEQALAATEALGPELTEGYAWHENTKPVDNNHTELLLNRSWRPAVSVVGMDGMPDIAVAGNVTLPKLKAKISVRLSPTTDADIAQAALRKAFTENVPFDATVKFESDQSAEGWHAPVLAPWLESAANAASEQFFDKPCMYFGEGGSIPFMGMLGKQFPEAQFFITGVLGPMSNAHGPNEFLHIPFVKRLTGGVASIIAAHFVKDA